MPHSTFHTMRLYALVSSLLWITISLLCFFKWYDPSIPKEVLMLSLILSCLISCVIGLFFSIPFLYAQRLGLSKSISFGLLFFVHLLFLVLNLSVEPRFYFPQKETDSLEYQFIFFVHKKIFKPNLDVLKSKWSQVSTASISDSKYIFLFGKNSLDQNKFNSLGKKMLENKIFFVHMENLINPLEDVKSNAILPLTIMAASHPQFMLFYRMGFFGFFSKSLQWRHVDKTNFSFLLDSAADTLSEKSNQKQHIFLFDWFDDDHRDQFDDVVSTLKKNPSNQVFFINGINDLVPSSGFQISEAYSSHFQDQEIFFYRRLLQEKKNESLVDCRLDEKKSSQFLCIFDKNSLFLFEKKEQPQKKSLKSQNILNLFFQLFSIDKNNAMNSSSHNSEPWNDFLNQFSIYKIDPMKEGQIKLLNNLERVKFTKENSQAVFDHIASHIIEN